MVETQGVAGVGLVPYTDDAAGLWDTWVGMGGEGIVLKDRDSIYRPGVASAGNSRREARNDCHRATSVLGFRY